MGALTDKLKALVVRVTSPDGQIDGVLHSWEQTVNIAFRDDSYLDYTEEALEHQLGRLLTLLVVGRQRGRHMALRDAGWTPRDTSRPHWDKSKREFESAANEAETFGESVDELIRIDSIALRSFEVRIAPGALDDMDEAQFGDEFASAVADLVADWRMVVEELREEYIYSRR